VSSTRANGFGCTVTHARVRVILGQEEDFCRDGDGSEERDAARRFRRRKVSLAFFLEASPDRESRG
jgi:hypothetical protein